MRITPQLSGMERYFLNQLAQANSLEMESALRMATGKKVNKPSDDPAAFFQISSFEQRLSVVQDAKTQVDAAATVGAETQLTIDEIRTQLGKIRTSLLLDEDGTLTAEQRTTEQATIDAAVAAIEDLARTETNGRRYLDGSVDYRVSGKNFAQVQDVEIYALKETTFSGTVTSAATQAQVTYNGSGSATITDDATFTLTGKRGSATISVTNGEALSAAVGRINQESHKTGITAAVDGNDIDFTSVDYGDQATINVSVASGTFNTSGTTQGTDAVATINGIAISSNNIDGNRVTYASNGTHLVLELQTGFTGSLDTMTVSDSDVAKFTLSTQLDDLTNLALPAVDPDRLGGISGTLTDLISGGSLSGLGSNTSGAIRVVDEALSQLTLVEGKVDGFADVAVASASSLLTGLTSSLEDSLEDLNGVDDDEELALQAKSQTLSSNTVAAMAILQQQQASVLAILQVAAFGK